MPSPRASRSSRGSRRRWRRASQVVQAYLEKAGLQPSLDALGFNIVGFGCTTCIGNSGPLQAEISNSINENGVVAAAVLSGNRNFEGRVSADVQANYLASPPLVVAYALAGSVNMDLSTEPLGEGSDGKPVYLKDIWPTNQEIQKVIAETITNEMFRSKYADVFKGDTNWQAVAAPKGLTYAWNDGSTYVQNPPYFKGITRQPKPIHDIVDARVLGLFGDKITTDHISPAGSIKKDSPAGDYLLERQVRPADFNQYGTRRGNHQVMMRGTFANIRIKNFMNKDAAGAVKEGGFSKHYPSGKMMPIYDVAMQYEKEGVPLIIMAGIEYGNGSSRDWAAKGTNLLGAKAVIAQSFERIHRSNLVGMGVVPFTFEEGTSWQTLGSHGRGNRDHPRSRRRQAAADDDRRHRPARRPAQARADPVPHRYARRDRVLQERRHPALRAAQPAGRGCLRAARSARPPRRRRLVQCARAL